MKKIEFSKKIFIVMFSSAIVFTVIAAVIALIGMDASAFSNIVLAIWGSVAAGEVSYYGKSKAENLLKIARSTSEELLAKASSVKDLTE